MKPKLALFFGLVLAITVLTVLLGSADSIHAGTFNPELKVTVANPDPEVSSDFSVQFNLPSGDVNFAAVVSFIPPDWGIVPGEDIPVGTVVGSLQSQSTLGLANGACSNSLPVEFTMLNGSLDRTDTVSFLDTDDNGTPDFAEDKDGNGLKDAVDKYPDFLNRLFPDLQPIRRSVGITDVAGMPIILQFLIFEPGTVIREDIPHDPELGYPSVTVLQNTGDPEAVPQPSVISDFCTPLSTINNFLGKAEDGTVLMVNPKDGKYTFTTVALGLPDADDDGYENNLDTCPYDPNQGDPRVPGSGDADNDGLDAACDPDDNASNSDEDGDNYQNRQDNCPLVPNGTDQDNQKDTDKDGIGDACDQNPDQPDGEYVFAQVDQEVVIGSGTGPGGPPAGFPQAGFGGAEEGEGGGLGTGAIIGIIIGVIAAVVIVGGGLAVLARRRA